MATFDHKHIVKTAEFDPAGRRMLTAGHWSNGVRLYDLGQSGSTPVILDSPSKNNINHAFFNHDGTLFYTAGDDKDVRVWDFRTHTQVGRLATNANVSSVELSGNGTMTVGAGSEVMFFDAAKYDRDLVNVSSYGD